MKKTYPYFHFSLSDPNETDLVLVSVHDSRTNFTVRTALPNAGKQISSIMAFAGARYSRSSLSANELFKEIKDAGKSANEKLANIFRNYGHASVADMAQLFAYIENVPKFYDTKFFYETSIGGGQARSSRFQDYSNSKPVPLTDFIDPDEIEKTEFDNVANKFESLQHKALNNYTKFKHILTNELAETYQLDFDDKKQQSALQARVFDCARYFLPNGLATRTSFCWITSAREWARLISLFKSSRDNQLVCLAQQLEVLFAPEPEYAQQIGYTPEAPDLIRYTAEDETTNNNLSWLKDFLEREYSFSQNMQNISRPMFRPVQTKLLPNHLTPGLKVAVQNILTIYPSIDTDWLIKWLENLSEEHKKTLGKTITQNFNHHRQMGNQFRTNSLTFELTISICEGLDLNRHRAWGRFIPMFSAEQNYYSILKEGYTLPAYLYENPKLSSIRAEFESDLQNYYAELFEFADMVKNSTWFAHNLILQLLPLGHIMRMFMHANPKEISYMTNLRVRPGGHINYRIAAWQMGNLANLSEPFMAGIFEIPKPDATSREEFLDRS